LRDATALGPGLTARFSGKAFVLVRGFLTDTLDQAGVMMSDQWAAVTMLGGRPRKPTFNSEDAPPVNAPKIAATIVKAAGAGAGPVFLVTHSKGSVDTLVALVEHPDLWPHVAGWISIQGAIQGSSVADTLSAEPTIRGALAQILRTVFGGSVESLESLRTHDRVAYLQAHSARIAGLVEAIPIVAYGSSVEERPSALQFVTAPFFGAEPRNDGLVALDRTDIPGARFAVLDVPGPDHGDAVTRVPLQTWDRIAMTHTLLSLLP
jgi:hypothetical protein